MAARNQLIIVAKAPRAGAVKRRLGADIGAGRASAVYRQILHATARRLAADRRWRTWLAVTPDVAISEPVWPAGVEFLGQGPGDLGRRMYRAMMSRPPGPVVLVGSDIPNLVPADIAGAFAALRRADLVIGPSGDGGYWLVGLSRRRPVRSLFDNVRWSTLHARADTLANAPDLKTVLLETRIDIDTGADLKRWAARRQSGF